MKKMILSTAALLTIVSLAACSNKQDTKKETSNSQSTTKVTSKSANTSKARILQQIQKRLHLLAS